MAHPLPLSAAPASAHAPMTWEDIAVYTGLDSDSFGIDEYLRAVSFIEDQLGIDLVRLDFGHPGLLPLPACTQGHSALIRNGVSARQYPPAGGIARLRRACARFTGQRLEMPCHEDEVFVTCGGTQAIFVAQTILANLHPARGTVVFLTPAYPPVLAQARVLGLHTRCIETDGLRGPQLISAVSEAFSAGDVAAIYWASPGNPSWRILTPEELQGIAMLCRAHGVVPIEDLTYLAMAGGGMGGEIPFPSIAHYSHEYFLVLSASKMLSYAGERIGFLIGAPGLLEQSSSRLAERCGTSSLRLACSTLVLNLTTGAPHCAQHGIADALEAINVGLIDLDRILSIYSERARRLKRLLARYGFYRVYDDRGLNTNGFYVCFGYPKISGHALLRRLLQGGISVLPLALFGSTRHDGVRACVGQLDERTFPLLEERLDQAFAPIPCHLALNIWGHAPVQAPRASIVEKTESGEMELHHADQSQ